MIKAAGHKHEATGKMQMGLAEKAVQKVQHLPVADEKRMTAYIHLGNALIGNGNYAEAEVILHKGVLIQRQVCGAEDPGNNNILANCLVQQCKYAEMIKLHRNNLRIYREYS